MTDSETSADDAVRCDGGDGSSRDGSDGVGEHGHDHDHGGVDESTSNRTLALVAAINVVGFCLELVGGLLFGSVALLGDAVHMLFDVFAYGLAFLAAYTAAEYDRTNRWSYGLHRLEPVAAFVNGALLLPMVGFILYESYHRFLAPVGIDPTKTILLAGAGLLVNVLSVVVLHGDDLGLNERGAFYHLLGDSAASVAVIVSTAVVALTGVQAVDPLTAVLIGTVVLWSAGKVLVGSGRILLDRSPVSTAELRATLLDVDGVEAVADLHVWQVCSRLTVATVAVQDAPTDLEDRSRIQQAVHDRLAALGIQHATVELTDVDGRVTRQVEHAH